MIFKHYTSRFNRRHKLFKHLFSGRYKSLIVDGSGRGYLRTVCDYVHLNPARAKLLGAEGRLRAYRWSSLGDAKFRQELLEAMDRRMGAEHYGQERQESAQAKAERIVAEELKRAGWMEKTLGQKPKGDPKKVKIAQRLRQERTMTLAWIAERLRMETKTHLVHLLYWRGKK